jgi:hypothetical protein
MKNGATYDVLGVIFEISGTVACCYFDKYSTLIDELLGKKLKLAREFKTVGVFEEKTRNATGIIVDGFENPIERKKNYEAQKEDYSGKKHTHTGIGLCISDALKFIYYISKLYSRSNVDYRIFKQEFPPKKPWFKNKKVKPDLGFTGIKNDYVIEEVMIRHKKSKRSKNNPDL